MRIVRRDSLIGTPWKNGGGETREIACFPPGSTLADFEWRISTAIVSQDGPFSEFEGIDRRLYLLEGNGLRLRIGSRKRRRLLAGDRIDFPGETPVHARLADGPVVDFNIMIRRDKHRAHVEELSICDSASIDLPWDTVAIFLREGCLHLSSPPHNYTAGPLDTLIFEKGHIERVEISGSADFILIGFDRLEHPGAWKLEETQDLRMLKKLILG